jgi:hypothetical protein
MSGAEVHANIVATLVDQAFFRVPAASSTLAMMAVLGSLTPVSTRVSTCSSASSPA